MKKTAGYKHPQRTLIEIRDSLNCSVSEAMRFTGFGEKIITRLLSSGDWQYFWEGSRRRIVTASIIEHQARKVQESKAS